MDIVLGVSLTPKTVRMVLVEGEKGDGAIVDHDTFDVSGGEGSATANVTDELVSAVLGTQESATEGGHVLKAIGVTWSDRTEAAALRDGLTARGITDVMLVSELHAAGALAQAAGRAVGYESTGLLFIDRDTATLSVVRSDDGSIVKVLSRSLHSTDALAVLADMVAAVERQDTSPQGMFVVGAGVDIASVKAHLADLVSIPVNAPEESGLALARGAALAAANAPAFDATTAGLAYALDPDGATAGNESVGLANASTQLAPVGGVAAVAAAAPYQAYSDVDPAYDDLEVDDPRVEEGRKPFLLVGSALTSIFVLGVVALVISLAVSIRPTADQRPSPGQAAIIPSVVPPAAPPPVPEAAKPAAPAPPPPAETIKAPVPVVQQAPAAPPRTVFVEPPQAPAPAPAAPPPAPAAPPPAPPVVAPVVPPVAVPPVWQPPVWQPPVQQRPIWQPPWQQQWPQRPPRDYDDYQPQRPPWQPPWQPPQQTQDPEPPVWQPPWQPQRPSRDEPEFEWPSQDNGNGNNNRNGNGNGSGRGSSEGSGGSQAPGANCFLIFCS